MSDVKIYVLHCGTITLDEKVAFGTKHPQLMKVNAQLTPERKRTVRIWWRPKADWC